MKIPKKLAETYNVEMERYYLSIHGVNNRTYISFPIDKSLKITQTMDVWLIESNKATLTLWKENHRTHLTIF